jgi:hypothetical protein
MKGGKGNEKPVLLQPYGWKEDRTAGDDDGPFPQMEEGTGEPEE